MQHVELEQTCSILKKNCYILFFNVEYRLNKRSDALHKYYGINIFFLPFSVLVRYEWWKDRRRLDLFSDMRYPLSNGKLSIHSPAKHEDAGR